MNKHLKLAIRVALTLVALALILYKTDLSEAWFYLSRANWIYVVLAFLSFFLSRIPGAMRINQYYSTQNLNLSEKLNLKLYFLGMFYNLFIPLAGGEGYKLYWIRKRFAVRTKSLLTSALLDRASGLVALIFLSAVFFMFSSFQLPFKPWFLLAIPLAYLGHYLVLRLFFKSFLPAFWSTHLHSLIIQALQVVTTYFVVKAIGVDENVVDYIFVFLLATFAFVLPMMGAREMAFVFGSEYLGLDMEISLAISLLFYLCLALSSLMGAYFLMRPTSLEKELQATPTAS